MTLTGKNFIKSARDAFFLVKRNSEKYQMVEGLGYVTSFIFLKNLFR